MFCENCGTQILDNSVFCSECGYKVSGPSSPEQRGPSSPEQRGPSSPEQRGPVPPVMRPTTAPRQPPDPYGKRTAPQKPSQPYGNGPEPRQTYAPSGQATDYQGADIISFGKYVLMIFLAGIPIINIILLVKWGFSQKQGPNKRNFAKALLFYYLIAVIIYVAYIWLWLKATSSI